MQVLVVEMISNVAATAAAVQLQAAVGDGQPELPTSVVRGGLRLQRTW